VERARHITTYLRDLADPKDPQILRYAKAVRCFLSNKAPRFLDANLLAGTTTSKGFGTPVHPEFPTMFSRGSWIPEDRLTPSILPQEAEELNLRILPYWAGCSLSGQSSQAASNVLGFMPRMVAFMGGLVGSTAQAKPWLSVVLEQGLEAVIAEAEAREACLRGLREGRDSAQIAFFRAVQEVLMGLVTYATNLGQFASLLSMFEVDEGRRDQLRIMAEVCAHVPVGPARTFREAVNAVWLMQIALHAGGAAQDLDLDHLGDLLYPWYRQDLDRGDLTVDEALELLGCLCLKLGDHVGIEREPGQGSTSSPRGRMEGDGSTGDLGVLVSRAAEWVGIHDLGSPGVPDERLGFGSLWRAMEALASAWAPHLFRIPGAEPCRSISITQ
jgi:formate C-acetyltransferase